MIFQFRTKIFLAIGGILLVALTAMFFASTATIQEPLSQYIDSEIQRVYGVLEQWQATRVQLQLTQGITFAQNPSVWYAFKSITEDLSNVPRQDNVPMNVTSEEAIREAAILTIQDTIESTLKYYEQILNPSFVLAIQTDGEILVSYGSTERPQAGENAESHSFWQMLNNPGQRSTPFIHQNRLYQTTIQPVELDNEVTGYIALGFLMDSQLLDEILTTNQNNPELVENTGIGMISAIFYSLDGDVLASNVPSELSPQLLQTTWEAIQFNKVDPQPVQQNIGFTFEDQEMTGRYWLIYNALDEPMGYEAVVTSKTQALSFTDELQLDFLIIAILALLLSGVVGYIVSRSVTKPVDQLVFAANQLTTGNLEHQIQYGKKDEMGVLADAFEHMRLTLLRRIQELAVLNASLEQKVQERTAELQIALENLKQAESHLVLSEKMVALGQMVAGIAHEINNPLNYIRNGITPLRMALKDLQELLTIYDQSQLSEQDSRKIEQFKKEIELDSLLQEIEEIGAAIETGAERSIQIVSNLRTFSRKGEESFKPADIHEGLESSLSILQHDLKGRIEIRKEYGEIPPVMCNLSQLNQVFLNILNNAQQAIEQKGRITIRTAQVSTDEVMISISDTGKGISPEHQRKIFEPFFTTKGIGKGTGLGLSISYGIVHRHGGRFNVISQLGEGTEFQIFLPVHGLQIQESKEQALLFTSPAVKMGKIRNE
ncbi:MAG: ATP-binding protein [bacterium]|jgi:two-component system NtrC family sensor kinase